jgi:hypothetical protein
MNYHHGHGKTTILQQQPDPMDHPATSIPIIENT